MPPSSKLPVKRRSAEPAPQKPDIRLPKDAIRAGRAGTKPLSEHLRKHEQKRIAAEAAKTSPRGKVPAGGVAAGRGAAARRPRAAAPPRPAWRAVGQRGRGRPPLWAAASSGN